jgi:hypothetical protein
VEDQKATVHADVDGSWLEYNSQIKFMFFLAGREVVLNSLSFFA